MTISNQTSELMCLLLHSLRNVITYADAIKQQPEVSMAAKQDLLNPIATKARWSIAAIEARIGESSREKYASYIRQADSVLFDNVKQLLSKLTPEQQSMVENLITAISKGTEIKIEHV